LTIVGVHPTDDDGVISAHSDVIPYSTLPIGIHWIRGERRAAPTAQRTSRITHAPPVQGEWTMSRGGYSGRVFGKGPAARPAG
jgi:hypothetical protein